MYNGKITAKHNVGSNNKNDTTINKNKIAIIINLVAKDMLPLEVIPYSNTPVHIFYAIG